ncbi:50S ribosomal protein L11 methyltransferase [Chitinivorax sp. B]|uniref:50S ribosomal protein L11 methyltransferase n=1 Tax=Chitinivorax sp. B TaxID=2502235 RepID=UPI0010F70BCD|nr:50S ribosomal protein L11 methyltransferase [Chitinivorax sp. B]
MSWLSVTIATDARHADALSDALFDLGALSTSIEDAHAGTDSEQPIFGEPGEPSDTVWEASHVIALFDADADVSGIIAEAATQCGIAVPAYQSTTVEEQDWVRATQAQFDPIRISDRLWITPTWHEPPNPQAINLQLDPGLAFGTGSHPTTRLCLQWLDKHLQAGETVLDYGCGSGILAIAAKKLGAGDCLGVDIDPQAIVASNQNAEQNQVQATFCLPDAMPGITYDVVVANILTNPLRMLAPLLAGSCRPGGRIALSGILESQAQEIVEIYSAWFDLDEPVFDDGWTCISGTKKH